MQDKKASRMNMNNLVERYQVEEPLEKQKKAEIESIKEVSYSPEENEKLLNYNRTILNLNPKYTAVTPLQDILVRCFLIEPEVTESGFIVSHKEILPIPTNLGQGTYAEAESPFPYSKKAVVVSVPQEFTKLKVGDIVYLSNNPVEAKIIGSASNAYFKVKNEFFLSDTIKSTPVDFSSEHYGYLMVAPYDVKAKLPNA